MNGQSGMNRETSGRARRERRTVAKKKLKEKKGSNRDKTFKQGSSIPGSNPCPFSSLIQELLLIPLSIYFKSHPPIQMVESHT